MFILPADKPPSVEIRVLPDGTVDVRTNDTNPSFAKDRARENTELQAALDAFRARGVARPVVITCTERSEKTARLWRLLEPTLTASGLLVNSSSKGGPRHLVIPTDSARKALRAVFGKAASRLFRVPSWPVSYWTVNIGPDAPEVMESRTFKDMGK
jgi:hypothetical protein